MECDCLNRCGDDPWLKDGRSEPCENLLAARLQDQQAKERAEKVEQIANRYGTKGVLSLLDLIIRLDERVKRIESLATRIHAAKGRHHTQLATCDLFDAVGLKNERPVK